MRSTTARSLAVSAAIMTAVLSSGFVGAAAGSSRQEASPKGAAEIAECLKNPSIAPETEVDFYDSIPPDHPDFRLFCGNVEVYGARHIHAGHPINNPANFRYCVMGGLSEQTPEPGNSPDSTAWTYPYGPGKSVTVITDNYDNDVITAFTNGPNSADWDGCAAGLPPAISANWQVS
jgi:hypothetical protein